MQKQKGFSLIELLITLAIFSIVVVLAVNLFINSVSSNRDYREKKQDQEIINVVSDIMYRDIVEADLEKTRTECETGYLVSLYVSGNCNYYYIEESRGIFFT